MEKQPIEQPEEVSAEPQNELAVPSATCPVGYYWNATLGKCVLNVGS